MRKDIFFGETIFEAGTYDYDVMRFLMAILMGVYIFKFNANERLGECEKIFTENLFINFKELSY